MRLQARLCYGLLGLDDRDVVGVLLDWMRQRLYHPADGRALPARSRWCGSWLDLRYRSIRPVHHRRSARIHEPAGDVRGIRGHLCRHLDHQHLLLRQEECAEPLLGKAVQRQGFMPRTTSTRPNNIHRSGHDE